ncbi:MAG: hypothetical protein Q4F71_05420 [Paracoccus sp. (in: a-proteobacteria)]|nr:hypothetical protein [Paracoccus sp. (in: a-proteobacteria)]
MRKAGILILLTLGLAACGGHEGGGGGGLTVPGERPLGAAR